MGGLFSSAIIPIIVATLVCSIVAAGAARLLLWIRPAADHQRLAFQAATFLPGLMFLLVIFGFGLDSFNPEPVSGPAAQGGLIIVIVLFGIVLIGVPVGYLSARVTLKFSARK